MHFNLRLNVTIERRENCDAIIKREIIFVQNNDFFDVAIDVAKKIKKNQKKKELSIIDFD